MIVLLVAGCGSGQPSAPSSPAPTGDASPSAGATSLSPSQTTAPSGAPSSATTSVPAVPYATVPTSANPAQPGSGLLITDVRVGTHTGYDRVVVELSGGQPGELTWVAEYDDHPHTQGKGDPVVLPGSAVLRVSVYGLTHPPAGQSTPSGLLADSAQGNITGVYVDPVFEGQAHVFIGLDAQRGFHVREYDSPTRIVIDIKNS